jgi:hypothetical protein
VIDDIASDVSMLALRYAAGMRGDDGRTSMRLYRFNSTPRNPVHMRMFSDRLYTRQYLSKTAGLDRSGDPDGFRLSTAEVNGWLLWRNTRPRFRKAMAGTRKVYVTAQIDYLPLAVNAVVQAAKAANVIALKFGADYANLRRPDRIVIYAGDRDHADEIVHLLSPRLNAVPADCLPFAERLSNAIFTGLDPPPSLPGLADGRRSWRGWLCHCLAESLDRGDPRDPKAAIEAALDRARKLAVDPVSWSVPDDFFRDMGGED